MSWHSTHVGSPYGSILTCSAEDTKERMITFEKFADSSLFVPCCLGGKSGRATPRARRAASRCRDFHGGDRDGSLPGSCAEPREEIPGAHWKWVLYRHHFSSGSSIRNHSGRRSALSGSKKASTVRNWRLERVEARDESDLAPAWDRLSGFDSRQAG